MRRDALERGLRLSTGQRAVLVLHRYVGWSLDEIAETRGGRGSAAAR